MVPSLILVVYFWKGQCHTEFNLSYYVFLYFSGITSEPHHMETAAPGSGPEPIVLGVQRCHQEIRTPRYVTEPCILCQEQQEVR